jgi:hypothetical protein
VTPHLGILHFIELNPVAHANAKNSCVRF